MDFSHLDNLPNLVHNAKSKPKNPHIRKTDFISVRMDESHTPSQVATFAYECGINSDDIIRRANSSPNFGQFRMVIGNILRGMDAKGQLDLLKPLDWFIKLTKLVTTTESIKRSNDQPMSEDHESINCKRGILNQPGSVLYDPFSEAEMKEFAHVFSFTPVIKKEFIGVRSLERVTEALYKVGVEEYSIVQSDKQPSQYFLVYQQLNYKRRPR